VVVHIATEPGSTVSENEDVAETTTARLLIHSPVQLDNLSSLYQFSDEENEEENDPEDNGEDHVKENVEATRDKSVSNDPLGLSAEYYLLPRGHRTWRMTKCRSTILTIGKYILVQNLQEKY
jgi:hypothetical protein